MNGHSWHLTLPKRELMKRKITPGVVLIVDFDDVGFRVWPYRESTEPPLSDTEPHHAKHK